MLRIVFVVTLIIVFVAPVYFLLKKRTIAVKSELEEESDVETQLEELKQKKKKLKSDCKEEVQNANKRKKVANKVQKKMLEAENVVITDQEKTSE